MTEAEKLRGELEKLRDEPSFLEKVGRLLADRFSVKAIMWMTDNKELVEALAKGAWQAVPKELSTDMDAAVCVALDREPDYSRAGFSSWWWHNALKAAPKKPKE